MALASADVSLDVAAGALATGNDAIIVIAPVRANADGKARQFGSFKAIIEQHEYCEAAEFAALFIEETAPRKPVILCGVPVATEGFLGQQNTTGNTGTSTTTLTAGTGGPTCEHEGAVRVKRGGTVGTSQIQIEYSLDGGTVWKTVNLGTATSYVFPYTNVTITFAVGTLVAGDVVHTWFATGPLLDAAGLQLARQELAKQQKQTKEWLVIGDFATDTEAASLVTEVNAYYTSNERDVVARGSIRDRLPFATLSKLTGRTSPATLTFAEVGATGDTIARAGGSWVTDGVVPNDIITVTGTASNNVSGLVPTVSALTLTLGTTDLAAEGPVPNIVVSWQGSLTFTNGANTILRNRGSWIDDKFRVGQRVTITGVPGNNVTDVLITTLTPTLMTLASGITTTTTVGVTTCNITAGELEAAYVASMETEFALIDSEERVSLSLGRARKQSPITLFRMRRPAAWAAAIRSYQNDVQVPTWQKELGPLSGWSLEDSTGVVVEYDDRANLAAAGDARFTCFRTWANGPSGTFISVDKTRAEQGAIVVQTHNMNVVNEVLRATRRATEALIGRVVALQQSNGFVTEEDLSSIETEVNGEIELVALRKGKQGRLTSGVRWTASRDDDFTVPEPTLSGELAIFLNGTVYRVLTVARARAGA